jgi:hypothetical protein
MKQRSPAAVFFLSLITFGIYAIVWQVKTKGELNRLGADIPTAWLLIVPLANLYWAWKYCTGVEQVTKGQISAVLALILMLLLSIVGLAILQSEFNKLSLQPAAGGAVPGPVPPAGAPTVPAAPLGSAPGPATGTFTPGSPSGDSSAPDNSGGPDNTLPTPPAPAV